MVGLAWIGEDRSPYQYSCICVYDQSVGIDISDFSKDMSKGGIKDTEYISDVLKQNMQQVNENKKCYLMVVWKNCALNSEIVSQILTSK